MYLVTALLFASAHAAADSLGTVRGRVADAAAAASPFPVLRPFGRMQLAPIQHMDKRSPGKRARDDVVTNVDGEFRLTVRRMHVRWIVIAVPNGDRNPQKAPDYWRLEICLPSMDRMT